MSEFRWDQPRKPDLGPITVQAPPIQYQVPIEYPRPKKDLRPWYYASPAMIMLAIFGKFAIRGMAEKPAYTPVGVSGTSREGRDIARHEIYLMIKNGNADEPSSYDLTVPATTNLSKAFKEFLTSRVQGEKNLARGFSQIDFEEILGEQNASQAGRAKAILDAKRADKIILDYCDFSRKNVVKFEGAWQAAMHETKPVDDKLDLVATKVRNQYRAASNKRFKLLSFFKTHPPKSDGTTLVFDQATQPTYEHLLVDYEKSLAVFEKGSKILEDGTEKEIQRQLHKLRDRGSKK